LSTTFDDELRTVASLVDLFFVTPAPEFFLNSINREDRIGEKI